MPSSDPLMLDPREQEPRVDDTATGKKNAVPWKLVSNNRGGYMSLCVPIICLLNKLQREYMRYASTHLFKTCIIIYSRYNVFRFSEMGVEIF